MTYTNLVQNLYFDPQKMDPTASRETLDHSIMYIFAVALQDGRWHHVDSYLPERAAGTDTVKLWQKISTAEDSAWTQWYHHPDPGKKAFGGKAIIRFKNGETLTDEMAVANAHPSGIKPFGRVDYLRKFNILTEGITEASERDRFLESVQSVSALSSDKLYQLNVQVPLEQLQSHKRDHRGIF